MTASENQFLTLMVVVLAIVVFFAIAKTWIRSRHHGRSGSTTRQIGPEIDATNEAEVRRSYEEFKKCIGEKNLTVSLDEYRHYVGSLGLSSYEDDDTGLTDSQMHDGNVPGEGGKGW
jgi:hypothetical protein